MPSDVDAAEVGFGPDDGPEAPSIPPDDDGKVACPECERRFLPGGIKRHITVAHGGTAFDVPGDVLPKGKKGAGSIAVKGATFQRSASFLVSMACKRCAQCLYEDAETDWTAIEKFCDGKPQLRKQVLALLDSADFVLLVGALGGTTQKMLSHHSIGAKLPFGLAPVATPDADAEAAHTSHDPLMAMAQFMQGLPEDELQDILQTAISQMAGGPIAPMGVG